MDYLQYGYDQLARHSGLNIISVQLESKKIWIKKRPAGKKNFWHNLQSFLAKTLRQPVLSATVAKGDSNTGEVERLARFRQQGISVPEIYAADDNIIVLSDLGDSLTSLLDENKAPEYRISILKQAASALAALHAKGLVHGKPYLRDMTMLADGQIGFIDLEEDPLAVMSLAQAQARDVWLFMAFAAKYARRDKYNYDKKIIKALFETYQSSVPREALKELYRLVKFLSPLGCLFETKFIWRIIGNDARRAVFINRTLLDVNSPDRGNA